MKSIIILLIITAIIFFVYRFITKRFKLPRLHAVNVVVGGVKSGKTCTSIALCLKEFNRRVRRVKIRNFFLKIFDRPLEELPLLYSNIPLGVPYVQVTTDLLNRKTRFVYGSVVLLDEISFVADKMLYKDEVICANAKDFFKLFGHETGGYGMLGHGVLIANTQSISDCSKEVRACISSTYYIDEVSSPFYIPFFAICHCREERYSEDGTTINAYTEDLDKSMCKFLFRKHVFKLYDTACYSLITDDLPVEKSVIHGELLPHLKTKNIVSFQKRYDLSIYANKEVKL